MRDLILRSKADERRTGRDGDDDADEGRRRGDPATDSANPEP
jgi:hypothetical protein